MKRSKIFLLCLLALSLAFGIQSCKDDNPETVPPTFTFSDKLNSESKTIVSGEELKLTIGNLTAESLVSAYLDDKEIKIENGVITLPTTTVGEHKVKVLVDNVEKEFTFKVILPALEIKTCALSSEETVVELDSELKLNLETNNPCSITVKVNGNDIEANDGIYILPTDKEGDFAVSVEFNDGQNEAQTRDLEYTVFNGLLFSVDGVKLKMIKISGYEGGDFYIAETETSQALWQAVMGNNPSYADEKYYKGGVGKDLPVNRVSWNDINHGDECFIKKLNAATGKSFRLPTGAEWVYAAKGGDSDAVYSGCNSEADLKDYAWYKDIIGDVYGCREVATKKANGYGLYDMSGNLWEWCEDVIYDSHRIVSGGNWNDGTGYCKVSSFNDVDPAGVFFNIGFRLALSLEN